MLGVLALSMLVSACSQPGAAPSPSGAAEGGEAAAPGTGGSAIGFIFVGTKDDHGYNQAAYIGSEAVEQAFPDMKVLRSENVPETAEAERVMEQMIKNGAKIIFPTSYGHLEPSLNVAKRHPDVAFFHQGGLKTADNLGTYFGTIWEPNYLAGVTAAQMSKTGKLGFIVSVPIPQVLLNVNAFQLGAQSVNPDATTSVVFTGSWCDPGQQANAANSLIDAGADVLGQHQDCTKTVIETAERRGVMSVGYHTDASALAPEGWLTGSVWNWSDLFVDMTRTAIDGSFKGSIYDGKYRGMLKDDVVQLTDFGASVPEDVRTYVLEQKQAIIDGTLHPFAGPVKDQEGNVKIEEGAEPDAEELEATDYLVEGVIGSIPK
ncbi:BMP family ABC transporter substrate-binding protein [Paenibacillus sp. 7541]|uniref:BMP family ABC transporter substrate-binding protein n=2 Tax=Paenibacillus TaxID=44249 RepID=A0A268EJP2_9BACL|nr:BMP family ABC transporter substrate-binding protein [Paenibacillus campinasensis]PAD73294.1 BMP family ABC transporter substrate-binding protein [Paenibacillus campinasensis]PAK49442.1 BMP family ABC transporter substrate-binding protein [Paenibacillus sp. 7541]